MKNWILGGGGSWKNQYRGGGLPKKVGLGHFADLRGAWQERGSDVFEGVGGGVDAPNAHYDFSL